MKSITVGIPAFKAQKHICDCLASIQMQTNKKDVSVIIASDNPDDDYSFVLDRYPDLSINILSCDENTGPGLARQRCLDACKTEWITFIDSDDVFFTPFSLESLYGAIANDVIEVRGTFMQEAEKNNQGIRMMPIDNPGNPWVFGRLYRVSFLRQNEIFFDDLRAMEDGEFNWKINMSIMNTPFKIANISDPVYLWRIGSEHSITRTGVDKDGIPQYNYDLCQVGATIAAIRAFEFCRSKNPFNGAVDRFATEMMVNHYFTYIECLKKKPIFAKQNLFNAKRFYNECYKEIENKISDSILTEIYTSSLNQNTQNLLGIIPEISFYDFMDKVKKEKYGGLDELKAIRAKYPKRIIENDIKTGVSIF